MSSAPPEQHDVIVIGGGPAGSATALALRSARPDLSVLILDRSDFPRDKSCGDAISPASVTDLEELGASGVADGYPRNTAFSFTGPGGRTASAAQLVRDGVVVGGYTIPREVFDERLLRAAERAGAEFRPLHKLVLTQMHAGARQVICEKPGGERVTLTADLLVGADGAYSKVRRALGVPRQPAAMTAISTRCYIELSPAASELGPIRFEFHRELLPAYAWYFPIDLQRANVGVAMPLQSLAGAGDRLEAMLDAFIAKLRTQGMPIAAVQRKRGHLLPHAGHVPPLAHQRAALVGDAGSMINPFSGEGIHYAMRSGLLLAEALRSADLADDAQTQRALESYERAFRARFGAHLRSGRLAQRLAEHPVTTDLAVRAASRGGQTLDSMYELLFGEGRLNPTFAARFVRSLVST